MKTRHLQITRDNAIHVDGHDISRSVTGYRINHEAGQPPEIELALLTHTAEVDAQAVVVVPAATRDTLILLGWTPPEEDQ